MVEITKEWRNKATKKLADVAKGAFFQATEARLIPTFVAADNTHEGEYKNNFIIFQHASEG